VNKGGIYEFAEPKCVFKGKKAIRADRAAAVAEFKS